jgi:hypothetical protein
LQNSYNHNVVSFDFNNGGAGGGVVMVSGGDSVRDDSGCSVSGGRSSRSSGSACGERRQRHISAA